MSRRGFEPTKRLALPPIFRTGAFNRSGHPSDEGTWRISFTHLPEIKMACAVRLKDTLSHRARCVLSPERRVPAARAIQRSWGIEVEVCAALAPHG